MKAIQIDGEDLIWGEYATPTCGPSEIRIQVKATAINRADLLQRAGGYAPPPGASQIMGLECAGEVVELGSEVDGFEIGDGVCALLAGGGYAEQVTVPSGQVLPIPSGLSFSEAAALPEVFATAYLNLYMEGELKAEERVILHAGASGIGTAAIQMLKHTDNPCFVTVGSQGKLDQCIALGAEGGSIRHEGPFLVAAQQWAGQKGVDLILDPVGAGYLINNLTVLGLGGRLVLIGLMGGIESDINLALLMMKRIRVIGSTLRARPIAEKTEVMQGLLRDVWPKIESGEIKSIIDTQFPIREMSQAHTLMAGNGTVGKIVLNV
jgi:putative PIG3 family NAD(P)H quinone oxidoreductase